MIVLWTIIVILSPLAPSTDVMRELCLKTGGQEILVQDGTVRDDRTGVVHKTKTIHCVPGKKPEKKRVGKKVKV